MFVFTPPFDAAVVVNSPSSIARSYTAASAGFGPSLTTTGVTGDIVLVADSTAPTNNGCEPLTNGAAVNGNIAHRLPGDLHVRHQGPQRPERRRV